MTGFTATLRRAWGEWWGPRLPEDSGAPAWAHLTLIFLWGTAIATGVTLLALLFEPNLSVDRDFGRRLGRTFAMNFVLSQCVSWAVGLLYLLSIPLIGARRINAWPTAARIAFFAGIPALGLLVGGSAGLALTGLGRVIGFDGRWFAGVALITLAINLVLWRLYAAKSRAAEAEQRHGLERARAADLERRALDAQLRTLQAQIEPHFLFNTLANVVSLIETAPAQARQMLERLIELLRASLAASRAPTTTLGQEVDLARAYLELLRLRMGPRLSFEIALPDVLRAQPVPPLLVQPLLENAIEHGLEPKIAGGRIALAARAAGDQLQIEVHDDGLGFPPAADAGVGLANLRERLAAHYGERGRLTIEDARPGTRVRLTLPLAAA